MNIFKMTLTIASGYIAFILFVPPSTIGLSYFLDIHNISLFIKGISIVFFILSGISLAVLLRTNLVFEKLAPINEQCIKTNSLVSGYKSNKFNCLEKGASVSYLSASLSI